jgi:hypothetical protein
MRMHAHQAKVQEFHFRRFVRGLQRVSGFVRETVLAKLIQEGYGSSAMLLLRKAVIIAYSLYIIQ